MRKTAENTILNFITSNIFATLLSRIGVAAMSYLLTKTHMFFEVNRGCLVQLSGVVLYDLPLITAVNKNAHKRSAEEIISTHRKSKKTKC